MNDAPLDLTAFTAEEAVAAATLLALLPVTGALQFVTPHRRPGMEEASPLDMHTFQWEAITAITAHPDPAKSHLLRAVTVTDGWVDATPTVLLDKLTEWRKAG